MENKLEFSTSRFSILQDDSDNQEEGENEQKDANVKKKKRSRKNKKKSSQNTQELRNLAFSKPVSAAVIQTVHRKNHAVENVSKQPPLPLPHELMSGKRASENIDHNIDFKSWEDWKSKDDAYVFNKFQSDMEAALRLSSTDTGVKTSSSNSAKGKKKHKNPTISFNEYCQLTATQPSKTTIKSHEDTLPRGYAPEELDPNHFEVEPVIPDEKQQCDSSHTKENKTKKKKKKKTDNKATLSDLLSEDTVNTNMNGNLQPSSDFDPSSFHLWQSKLEEKNQEMITLVDINKTLNEELSEVKKRNKQLCFILAQGEMKEKSKLIQQVNELNSIKTELSTELQTVCSQLEQERSKVSHLRQELVHLQGSRTHCKSITEENP